MKIFRNAYGQRIVARSITYNCEKCTPPRPQRNCGLHPLIHTRLEFTLAQDMSVCQRGEKKAPTDQSSSQGQWGPPLKGHQGEADEEYHRGPCPH